MKLNVVTHTALCPGLSDTGAIQPDKDKASLEKSNMERTAPHRAGLTGVAGP